MEAKSIISSAQIGFSDFTTFIVEQAKTNPITTIFLVVLPFLGIAALGALGLRKIYQSYKNPTVDKIQNLQNPVVNPKVDTKPTQLPTTTAAKTTTATPSTVVDQKPVATGTPEAQQLSFTAVKVIQAALLGLSLLGAYTAYTVGPSVIVSEAVKGYYANWAQTPVAEALSGIPVDLATQCTLDYSIAQGGYSWGQYIYAPFYVLSVPSIIKNNVTSIFRNTVNLLSPIRNEPAISQPAVVKQPAPQSVKV